MNRVRDYSELIVCSLIALYSLLEENVASWAKLKYAPDFSRDLIHSGSVNEINMRAALSLSGLSPCLELKLYYLT